MRTSAGSMPQNQQRSQLSALYLHHVRNGGDVTTRSTDASGISRRVVRRPRQQRAPRAPPAPAWRASPCVEVLQQRPGLLEDDGAHVPPRRHLLPRLVDLPLGRDRRRLIRRQRVDREEPGRVAGQPVDGHHPNPAIDGVERAADARARAGSRAAQQICVERLRDDRTPASRAALEPGGRDRWIAACAHVIDGRRAQPRREQHGGQRIDVVRQRHAAGQRGLERRRAAARERIVDDVARLASGDR